MWCWRSRGIFSAGGGQDKRDDHALDDLLDADRESSHLHDRYDQDQQHRAEHGAEECRTPAQHARRIVENGPMQNGPSSPPHFLRSPM